MWRAAPDWTVLPVAGIQWLTACPADWPAVDEQQRFTVYWLECSLLAGEPLPPTRGAPLYQPLPYSLPLAGMSEVM